MEEINKAHVDIQTRKIYNAVPETFEWYHEQAHLIFNDEKSELIMNRQMIEQLWLGSLTVSVLLIFINMPMCLLTILFSLGCFIGKTISEIREERWCNNFAKEKLEEK